jgi:hypothetical protein
MHIDSYQFGEIIIDGVEYTSDLLIIAGAVWPNWWRKQGHLLSPEDLVGVIEAKPGILVVGCGASGIMKISEKARDVLQANNIKLEDYDTSEAVERFNELSAQGANVAAALHLTC